MSIQLLHDVYVEFPQPKTWETLDLTSWADHPWLLANFGRFGAQTIRQGSHILLRTSTIATLDFTSPGKEVSQDTGLIAFQGRQEFYFGHTETGQLAVASNTACPPIPLTIFGWA